MKNVLKPIRYSYDHCTREYAKAMVENLEIFPEEKFGIREKLILEMPGIDYSKIENARKA